MGSHKSHGKQHGTHKAHNSGVKKSKPATPCSKAASAALVSELAACGLQSLCDDFSQHVGKKHKKKGSKATRKALRSTATSNGTHMESTMDEATELLMRCSLRPPQPSPQPLLDMAQLSLSPTGPSSQAGTNTAAAAAASHAASVSHGVSSLTALVQRGLTLAPLPATSPQEQQQQQAGQLQSPERAAQQQFCDQCCRLALSLNITEPNQATARLQPSLTPGTPWDQVQQQQVQQQQQQQQQRPGHSMSAEGSHVPWRFS